MRFVLNGEGLVIPLEALPIPSEDGDLPPQTLLLPTGDFLKQDYVGLGYTHFEVWCIGAVGGAGGSYLESSAFYTHGSKNYGGGGGGGGLHHVAGLLADLPDATPVVVGQAGIDGVNNLGPVKWSLISDYGGPTFPDQKLIVLDSGARPFIQNGVTYINADGSYVAPYTKIDVLGNPVASNYQVDAWGDSTPTPAGAIIPNFSHIVKPNPLFVATQDGADGGYSKFGDVAKASGGKGGKRAPIFSRGVFVGLLDERGFALPRGPEDGGLYTTAWQGEGRAGGDGGRGGIGGSLVAGGGGAGGSSIFNFRDIGQSGAGEYEGSTSVPPEDGTWDGDIGEGGGGGRGGGFYPAQFNNSGFQTAPSRSENAQSGGQGSFNYGDTSKYGPRQNAVGVIPGAGGGAKFNALQMYGGRAVGANPNGAVLLRVVKLS